MTRGTATPRSIFLALTLGVLAYSVAQNATIPIIPLLADHYNASVADATWTVTGYYLAAAVMTPALGRLGDMFGKRRMLVIVLLLFGAGGFIAAIGNSLPIIIVGRLIQGAGGGIYPLGFGIIRDEFPAEKVASSIGLLAAMTGVGSAVGLAVAGVIAENLSLHWIFWLGAVSAVVAAGVTQLVVPESPSRSPGHVDVRGAVVLGAGLAVLLFGLSRGAAWGWLSAGVIGCAAVGIAILAAWVWLERRTAEPLLDVELMRRPPVVMANVATLFSAAAMMPLFVLIPPIITGPAATYGLGLDLTMVGPVMAPGSLAMLGAGYAAAALASRFGTRVALAFGCALCSAGLILLAFEHSTAIGIAVINVVGAAGVGIAFSAMPNLIIEAVPRAQTGEAAGVHTVVRNAGHSFGGQIAATILAATAVAGVTTNRGFTIAFLVAAGSSAIAAIIALLVPRAVPSRVAAASRRRTPA